MKPESLQSERWDYGGQAYNRRCSTTGCERQAVRILVLAPNYRSGHFFVKKRTLAFCERCCKKLHEQLKIIVGV